MIPTDVTPVTDLLNMDDVRIDPNIALKLPAGIAVRRRVLPFAQSDNVVHVAYAQTVEPGLIQVLEKFLASLVKIEPTEPGSLSRAIDRVYGDLPNASDSKLIPRSVDLRNLNADAGSDPVLLGQEIMHAAIVQQASDIHLEPDSQSLGVRFRVDGHLETYRRLPATAMSGVINRFKVMCGMDIAERRSPQDGSFKHRFARGTQTVDVRVATLPTRYGERMTLRLLAHSAETLTLERLGMGPNDLATFRKAIELPHGLVLLTGPTGSGKTTTLHAAIRYLIEREPANVITVEDPIEYEIAGVSQVEVDSTDKVSFVKALRSVLRHDPDVLMIGEIRDQDTADIAIKASLTGHLVFSTLHTNTAANVITRLADIGIDRYLVSSTLRLSVAQRLVRRLCKRCRVSRTLTAEEARKLGRPEAMGVRIGDVRGCLYCGHRGYCGRIGIFEVMPVDEPVSQAISDGLSELEVLRLAGRSTTLRDDALEKLKAGEISLADAYSAIVEW